MIDVSIIIPCYNTARYLDDCLSSAMTQTGVRIEVIAIDDASTDQTWDSLCNWKSDHPNLLSIERLDKNRGQAHVRNLGLKQARGEFVAFLDSDDQYRDTDTLQRWLETARMQQAELCVAQRSTLYENGKIAPPLLVPVPKDGTGNAQTTPELTNTTQCWQILYRNDFLTRHSLAFSSQLRQREDRLFFLEAFLRADRIAVTKQDVILYRDHANSTMRRIDLAQLSQLNTHLKLASSLLQNARAEGRVSPDFERANIVSYWCQLARYWHPLIIAGLSGGDGEERSLAQAHLHHLDAMSRGLEPLYLDTYRAGVPQNEELKREASLDVMRMAVSAGRNDILIDMLKGERIHISRLIPLIEQSTYVWARDAVQHYLKFNRLAQFKEEQIETGTPQRLDQLVKRVVLHIGMPKTGSSSVQEHILSNRLALLDQGVHFPIFGAGREHGVRWHRSSGHLALFRKLLIDNEGDMVRRRLAAEITSLEHPVHTLVLSCENLLSPVFWNEFATDTSDGQDILSRIAHGLGIEQFDIALTLRRPDGWFQSYYRELTANPFNNFIATPSEMIRNLDETGVLDHRSNLDYLKESQHVANLHVTGFGEMKAQGGAIPWFFNILGMPDTDTAHAQSPMANESLSDTVAANIQLLKKAHPDRKQAEHVFKELLVSNVLDGHDFDLIGAEDWGFFDETFGARTQDYDALFPQERAVARPGDEPTPLVVHPMALNVTSGLIWNGLQGTQGRSPLNVPLAQILEKYRYMTNSLSWKITRPLRRALEALRRLRQSR